MQPNVPPNSILESLRLIARREKGVTVRVFASVAATFLMIAIALVASFVTGYLTQRFDARRGAYYFYVTDSNVAAGFAAATPVWGAILYWIWRGQIGRSNIVGPIISTIIIVGITACIGTAIDEFIRREEEYLIAATCLVSAAFVCMIWMRYTLARLRGNPVLSDNREVNILCPECGYSLIGLNELRCPECGTTFAIDELIRAQGYGKDVLVNSAKSMNPKQVDHPRRALPVEESC